MMELVDKVRILADSAKYDVSCSSSGSNRQNNGGLGNGTLAGICHSWTSDGRCISLLKILFSNDCIYDCAYCINRHSNDIERATFTIDEIVDLTIKFYRRNYIEGLFLSSAVFNDPNSTMETLIEVIRRLRYVENFNGYIHLKGIPGTDDKLMKVVGMMVDRVSVNIELPSSESLRLLAPQKKKEDIIHPMKFLKNNIEMHSEYKRKFKAAETFVPAGQSTQLMVGATNETDLKILTLAESLYQKMSMKRVYYSAYVPVVSDSRLPIIKAPPLFREHRIYQADWLLRFYKFKASEILDEKHPNFNPFFDPKCQWALNNLQLFPMEVNRASYEMLLRVPGIGLLSARRIINARRYGALNFDDLKKIGVVLKRAKFFILCKGKYMAAVSFERERIERQLLLHYDGKYKINNQLHLADLNPKVFLNDKQLLLEEMR